MTESKQKVKDLCDKLMQVHPEQILIDLVQDEIEEILCKEDVTPDDIGAALYMCSILKDIYNPVYNSDIAYLAELIHALDRWLSDAEFANKSLGLDPNK